MTIFLLFPPWSFDSRLGRGENFVISSFDPQINFDFYKMNNLFLHKTEIQNMVNMFRNELHKRMLNLSTMFKCWYTSNSLGGVK